MNSLGTLHFHPAVDLDAAALSAVQRRIRVRVLRLAVRHGVFTPDVAAALARWGHGGGFSLHAGVFVGERRSSGAIYRLSSSRHQDMNPAERRPVAGGAASPKRPEQRLQSLAFEDAFGAPDVGRVLSDMHFFLAPAAGGKCL